MTVDLEFARLSTHMTSHTCNHMKTKDSSSHGTPIINCLMPQTRELFHPGLLLDTPYGAD